MRLPNLDRDQYTKTLKSKGYKYLNSGAFGSVYSKGKGSKHVIKVCGDEDNYIEYLKHRIPGNPFFPKIHSIKKFYDKEECENWFAVKMERLIPYSKVPRKVRSKIEEKHGLRHGIEDLCDNIDLLMWGARNKQYKNFLKVLNKMFDRYRDDMHDGNVMFRKRGRGYQLVVTDPIV